jgi:hypothetical protein
MPQNRDLFDMLSLLPMWAFPRAKVKITAAKSIGISNMVLHVLWPGTRFSLKTRLILDQP